MLLRPRVQKPPPPRQGGQCPSRANRFRRLRAQQQESRFHHRPARVAVGRNAPPSVVVLVLVQQAVSLAHPAALPLVREAAHRAAEGPVADQVDRPDAAARSGLSVDARAVVVAAKKNFSQSTHLHTHPRTHLSPRAKSWSSAHRRPLMWGQSSTGPSPMSSSSLWRTARWSPRPSRCRTT